MPENQCVFIRGFRVVRSFWLLPKQIKAAAGPSPDPEGHDYDPSMGIVSVPAITKVKDSIRVFLVFSDLPKYRDPLHVLLHYIAEVSLLFYPLLTILPILTGTLQQAYDCEMVLAHDDDLAMIDGLGHDTVSRLLNSSYVVPSRFSWQSLESLEPDVMMDLLRKSNIEIHKDSSGEPPNLIQSRL